MEPRTLAVVQAAGRIALGTALMAMPARTARAWVGRDARRPGVQVVAAGMGARDAGIGLGTLMAVRRGAGAAGWIRAGVLADAVDFAATLRARDALPAPAVVGVGALAAGSAVLGAYLQATLD